MCLKQRRLLSFCSVFLFFSFFLSDSFAGSTGYYDAEHTRDDGYYNSSVFDLLSNRYVFGESARYLGGAAQLGDTVWVYDIVKMTYSDIGYYDAEHTKDDGTQLSAIGYSLADRFITGSSRRYSEGASILGQTMWVYDLSDAGLTKLGFYNAMHTKNDGYKYSSIDDVKTNGYVRGISNRYNGGAGQVGETRWIYDSVNNVQSELGFYDTEHVRNDGYAYGEVHMFTDSGYITGYSQRYNGGASWLGDTAWVYDIPNTQLRKLGFYDAEHTKDTGYQYSRPEDLTESGYVSGYSERYNGGAVQLGRTAWVYDIPNAQLHEVGFYDAEHTKDTGYQFTDIQIDLSESGYAVGTSKRYNGGAVQLGQTAWVYDILNTNQIKIGYYDAEHTKDDGSFFSAPGGVTSSGYVRGASGRYNGGAVQLGQTAWIYDIPNVQLHKVGLYDAEHTKDTGYQQSYIAMQTESGYAGGFSARYNGGASSLGNTRWVYDVVASNLHKVGYRDAEHTKDTGYTNSDISTITNNGYAFGYSDRYNSGNPQLGKTAWVYDISNSVHTKLGFYDAEHTSDSGRKQSLVQSVLTDGHAHGLSERYSGGAPFLGYTAWVYDAQNAILAEVGIYDAAHTSDIGYQYTEVETLLPNGYTAGYSRRYNDTAAHLGDTAWLYHIPTARQVDFNFGEDINTGEGWSRIKIVQDNGVVYGVFGHLDNTQHVDGERVFKGDINGEKEDLFDTVGGDILNYHFQKDSISIDISDNGKYLIGDGLLRADYHPLEEGVAFLLVLESDDNLSYYVSTDNQRSLAYVLGETASYVGVNAIFYQYLIHHIIGSVDLSRTFQQMIPQASSYSSSVGVSSMRLVSDTISTNNFSTMGSQAIGVSGQQEQLDQATSGLGDNESYLYGKYIYSKGSQNGNIEHDGYDFNSRGITFGADFIRGDNGIFGAAIGFLETDIDGEKNTGDIDQTSFSPNIYLGLSRDNWKINTGFGYGVQRNDSERYCGIPAVGNVSAKWDSHSLVVFTSAIYNIIQTTDSAFDFTIGLDYMSTYTEGYNEKGADLWNMEIDSNTSNNLRSKFGCLFTKNKNFANGFKLSSQVRSFWLHDYINDNVTTVVSFNGSSSFDIAGLSQDRDRLQIGFTLDLSVSNKMSLFLTYDHQLSENAELHEINTGVRYKF